MTLSNESFCTIPRLAITDEPVSVKVFGNGECSTRDEKEINVGENFLSQTTPKHAPAKGPPSGNVHVKIPEVQQEPHTLDGSTH